MTTTETAPTTPRELVLSGGRPFILLTVVDDEGGVDLATYGIPPENVPIALRDVADQLSDELLDESAE